ncbi:MAG TPA: DUF3618 domain-containing protein [Ktedonobacterales bacterium]|nr:DUF3618 domain-containing protein [Ktedonobacterales bacterium]
MGERSDDIERQRDEPGITFKESQEIAGRNAESMRENLSSARDTVDDSARMTPPTSDDYVVREPDKPGDSPGDESTDEIRDGIADTRARMGSTIDAIQDRLSPQNLVAQAKDAARDATIGRVQEMAGDVADTARETGSTLMDTIRENPVPVALTAIGLGWLLFSARRQAADRREWEYRYGKPRAYDRRYGNGYYRNDYSSNQQQGQGNNRVEQVTDRVQDAASKAGDHVQDAMSNVADKAGDMADYTQAQTQRVQGWFERTWNENPLLLAGGALVLGAIVGLAIPETPIEDRMMGDARDTVVQKAQGVAEDTVQKAKYAATEATDQMAKQQSQPGSQQAGVERGSSAGE